MADMEKSDIRSIIETNYNEEYFDNQVVEIVKNLIDKRNEKGLSQREIAERANLSMNYIYKLEKFKANMSIITCLKLCNALEITPMEVFPVDNSNKEVTFGQVFELLTENMSNKKRNAVLEIVRICRATFDNEKKDME